MATTDNRIQSIINEEIIQATGMEMVESEQSMGIFSWLVRTGETIPPWWSTGRDIRLGQVWKESSHLASAIYNAQSKMLGIPPVIVARNSSNEDHVAEAEELLHLMNATAGFGEGWLPTYAKFIEDYLVADNGAFLEVIGDGPADGPIIGLPLGVRHLDSSRCLGRDSRVKMADGSAVSILKIVRDKMEGPVLSVDRSGNLVSKRITNWHSTSLEGRHWLRIKLENGSRTYGRKSGLWVTNDHEFLTPSGWQRADELIAGSLVCTPYPDISEQQSQVLVGTMLGDGHMRKSGRSSVISLGQGFAQEEWLRTKMRALGNFAFNKPRINRLRNTLQAESKNSPALNSWVDQWYVGGKKVIPVGMVMDNLTPLMLATWYMDDGSIMFKGRTSPAARLHALAITTDEREMLCNLLRGLGIDCTIHANGDIYITTKGARVFFGLIAPYIVPCLRYKLPPGSPEFNPLLWDEIEHGKLFFDEVESIRTGDNGQQTATYCIDVEDTHNFVAGNMVVHNCTRTGHPLYPVIFMGDDSRWYKLFWTRVIYMSQMTSPRKEMNGVGLSGVSRCIEVAQTLVDMIRYKQERLGSRPQNQMLVGKGLTGKTIMAALRRVEEEQNSMGFTRYAKTVAVGSENPDISIEKIDLTHLDPFDEAVSTNLGMYVIAAALGMDADEIWPSAGGSASKGEADLRRMRSRGRLPAQLTGELSKQFNLKVMPPYLKLDFDFKDDEQDQQQAIVRDIRGRNRTRDLENGTMTTHSARRNMLIDEDIDQFTYNDMELGDGRLPDGTTIGVLFFDNDPIYTRYLRFMSDPLLFTPNILDEQGVVSDTKLNEVIGSIQSQRQLVLTALAQTTSGRKVDRIKRAYHALDWLEEKYLYAAGRILPEVPTVSRSSRTDIRVAPVEVSPPVGTASPAEGEAGPDSRNSQNVTGND